MFKDFAIYGINPSNGAPLTDPAISYVRNGADATSGGVGNPWTRPYVTFVPDRDVKYLGVGARITSLNLATIGQEQNNAQYFTKWQLERAQSNGTPRAFTPAREVQIIVKPDVYNMFTYPSFEAAGSSNAVIFTNLAVDPRGTDHRAGVAGAFWNDRYPGFTTYTYNNSGGADPAGIGTYARLTVTGTQAGLGWTIAENPEVATPGADSRMISVSPGELVHVSHWVRPSVATGWQIAVRFAASGAWVGGAVGTNTTSAGITVNGWTRVSHAMVVPAGVTRMAIYSVNTGGAMAVGATVDATGLMIVKCARQLDYFDGGLRTGRWDHTDFNALWNSTANNSTSSVRATTSVQGSFPSRTVATRSTAWKKRGDYSMRITTNASTDAADHDAFVEFSLLGMGVREGETYTLEATLRQDGAITGVPGGNQDRSLFLVISGGGGTYRGFGATVGSTNAAGEYVHRLTFTVPSVAGDPVTVMSVRFYGAGAGSGGGDVWWDEVTLVKGTEPGSYVDGSMGDDYLWEGTAHESRSYYYENRLDRVEAIRRALRDSVPLGIGVAEPKFAVWTE